jgi:hypothetical protein
MEAATPLPLTQVRFFGDRLMVDGLMVDDECAVRLAREHDDPARLIRDAVEIGARVLDREQAGANAEFVKAEFEKAARELDAEFVERARRVSERLDQKVDEAFGSEHGVVSRALERHFGDNSNEAVHHKVRLAVAEVAAKMREDLQKQFSSDSDSNPLAGFQKMAIAAMRDSAGRQAEQLRLMDEKLAGVREEVIKLQAEREKLAEVEAEREKGTAKGRSFEESVVEALDRIALPQGDDCLGVGDVTESTGKTGDAVVSIGACHGPVLGRIVFEAKDRKLSRPKALEELDKAMAQRNAQYGVLVVPSEEEVPAKMLPLREYNGDKLIVPFDPEDGSPLALQVAYSLARARVLMSRGENDGIDGAAVAETVERALAAMEDVRRIKQQLTGAKTQIDKAADIVDVMAGRVKAHLDEIDAIVCAGAPEAAGVAEAATDRSELS